MTTVVELPYVEANKDSQAASSSSEPVLTNTIGAYRIQGSNVTGRLSSLDDKTYIDLEEGQIIINDGSNDRILIGKF